MPMLARTFVNTPERRKCIERAYSVKRAA